MNELEIADYLHTHPDFFTRHGDCLLSLKFASSRGSRVVSLQERQLEVLWEKHKQLEYRAAEMLRNGRENDAMLANFTRWASCLLAETDTAALPNTMIASLRTVFDVPAVAVRMWGLVTPYAQQAYASAISPQARQLADTLKQPYCGVSTGFANTGFAAAVEEAIQWLTQSSAESGTLPVTPTGPSPFASIGLIALRLPAHLSSSGASMDTSAFGLLVMGSPDPQRFHTALATDFLAQLALLASATLSPLSSLSSR
jgi:uncharacterized protein YigA (DUF484 family)